jgi:hypothetical protein
MDGESLLVSNMSNYYGTLGTSLSYEDDVSPVFSRISATYAGIIQYVHSIFDGAEK